MECLSTRLNGSSLPAVAKLKGASRMAAAGLAAFIPVMVLASGSTAQSAARSPGSLCTSGEKELFSCPIHSKILSICGMPDGKAAYRFGRPGHVELQSRDLRLAEQGYSGGGEDQVSFQTNGYRYVIYARTVRTDFGDSGQNAPQSTSGLFVQKNGRTLSSVGCGGEGDQPIYTLYARHYIMMGQFVSH